MEGAESETQEVAVMATASRTVQLPTTLLYQETSVAGRLGPCLHLMLIETVAFVDYLALIFEPPMLCKLHALNPMALHSLVVPQTAPLQDNC